VRLVAVAAAAALLAGCSNGADPSPAAPSPTPSVTATAGVVAGDPTSLVRASADAARREAGAAYTFLLAGRSAPNAPVDRISGVGRIDLVTDTAATRGDFGLASEGRQYDVVTRGTLYWLSVPPRYRTGYVKTPWVSTTLTSARLGMSTLGHPGTYLDLLRGASAMSLAGTEDVRGVTARHYTGRILASDFLGALPAGLRDGTRAAFAGVAEVHLEVWLDPQGRPWRVRSRATVGRTEVESAFDVTRYGPVATVTVPDQVTPLPRVETALQAAGVGTR
jgi:hypothetical protein